MNRTETIEYGKFISKSSLNLIKNYSGIKLKWWQLIIIRILLLFSNNRKIKMCTDDNEFITFKNGRVVGSTNCGDYRCIDKDDIE